MTARLVVLASGSGSTLQAILEADLPATIVAAGTDRGDCQAMDRACAADIETFALEVADTGVVKTAPPHRTPLAKTEPVPGKPKVEQAHLLQKVPLTRLRHDKLAFRGPYLLR